MSTAHDPIFETALSMPQAERAELALQLLQSLDPPGAEASAEAFGAELRGRVGAYRRGELGSASLSEVRAIVERRLSEESRQ